MDVMHWGSTQAERTSHFPCDDTGFASDHTFFRAIDIDAPPRLVYRWLAQLRVAPYSYDVIDNFARPSPSRLTPGTDALAIGQRIMIIFRISGFEPGRSLSVTSNSRLYERTFGDIAGSYRVDATEAGSRLVAKILVRYPGGFYGRALRATLPALDLVMFRKQLLTLKAYAERDAAALRYRSPSPRSL